MMWCGSWGRVAMDFGCALGPRGRGSSGLASAHPWDAGEGQRGNVGHFQFFRGSRFAACCLLARASVLWRKYCRNSLVMPFPGFVSDGAVWLQGCSQKGDFGL